MKKFLFLLLFLTLFGGAFAASPFSKKGFTKQNLGLDIYSAGMGYSGSADLFRFNPCLQNPSVAATTSNVKFSTGLSAGWRYFKQSDDELELSRSREYDLPFFNIVIPIGQNFFAFDFASGYSGDYEFSLADNKEEFFSDFYKVGLVYDRKTPWFNIGVGGSYYVGSAQSDQIYTDKDKFAVHDTNDVVTQRLDSVHTVSEDFESKAFSYNIGVSKEFENFSLGAYYYPAVKLSGDNEFSNTSTIFEVYKYTQGSTIGKDSAYTYKDSTIVNNKKRESINLPEIFGVGFTYKFDENWKLSLDADYQIWKASSFFADEKMDNTFNFGIGLAYDMDIDPWYWNFPFRFGYYRKEFPFKVQDHRLVEHGITAGFDIPVADAGEARASVALEYSTRGSKADNGYNEQEFKLSIGFIGFDVFKSRPTLTKKREIPIASQNDDQY